MKTDLRPFMLGASLLLGLSHTSAAADLGMRHFGVRAGVSANPDQFQGGVFLDAGEVLPGIRLQPSADLGIGNGVRLVSLNVDAVRPFSGLSWRPYAGGGLGLNFIDVTSGVGAGRGMSMEPVLNVIGGVERRAKGAPRAYVIEGRLGFGDTPDFKIMVGMTLW